MTQVGQYVVIDEDVHSNFQEGLNMISNDMNSDYNVEKPFSVADAVKGVLSMTNRVTLGRQKKCHIGFS